MLVFKCVPREQQAKFNVSKYDVVINSLVGPVGDPLAGSLVGPVAGPVADPLVVSLVGPVAGPVADPIADPPAGSLAVPLGGSLVGPVVVPVAGIVAAKWGGGNGTMESGTGRVNIVPSWDWFTQGYIYKVLYKITH